MAKESEVKTSAERFLARVKDFTWLGTALAATVTAIWAATTYLNDKRLVSTEDMCRKIAAAKAVACGTAALHRRRLRRAEDAIRAGDPERILPLFQTV